MAEYELGKRLKDMYDNAKRNEAVVQIHLFGIQYGDIIKKNRYSVHEIVIASGIGESYAAEVSKGIKLGQYVTIKQEGGNRNE